MRTGFRISSLVPSGLAFDGVSDSEDSVILAVRSEAAEAQCPLCATASRRVHSRYIRRVADLPSAGRKVRLRLLTRRFTCEVPHCRRQIFAERFGEDVVPLRRRRTARLEHIVHHLGLALGGRPAASFAKTNRKVQRNFWRAGTLLIGARFVLHQRLGIAEFSS